MSKTTNLEKSLAFIKKAGFSHIKVELEADLGRDGDRYCHDCEEGRITCLECEETGVIVVNGAEQECDECYGEGYSECDNCDGEGYQGGYYSEEHCDDFMRNYIKENYGQELLDRLTYGEFYEDGSVDSEFTFTVPIEHAKDIVPWINSFKALAEEEIGSGLETGGAGMHISVIPDYSNGVYPVYESMPVENIRNFREQLAILLPSLYFLASPNSISRGLTYRQPQISARDKYSAIFTHSDTTIEYRLFETTYDNPEDIFEQIEVVANTLKFYADPTLKVETQGKIFPIGEQVGRDLKRFYNTPEKIMILRKQLSYLKPSNKSMSVLFRERGVLGITEIRKETSKRRSELRREWHRQNVLIQERLKQPATEREMQRFNEYKEYQVRYDDYTEYSDAELMQMARGLNPLQTLQEYINQKLFGGERYQITV